MINLGPLLRKIHTRLKGNGVDEGVPIKGFESYKVFRDGRVWSAVKGKFLKRSVHWTGFATVGLTNTEYTRGKVKNFYVHCLVADAFLPKVEGKNKIRHLNGNKQDNRVENLQWVSKKESQKDASGAGAWKNLPWKGTHLPHPHRHKLTEEEVLEIIELLKAEVKVSRIAREYGIKPDAVYRINHKKTWKYLTDKHL